MPGSTRHLDRLLKWLHWALAQGPKLCLKLLLTCLLESQSNSYKERETDYKDMHEQLKQGKGTRKDAETASKDLWRSKKHKVNTNSWNTATQTLKVTVNTGKPPHKDAKWQ